MTFNVTFFIWIYVSGCQQKFDIFLYYILILAQIGCHYFDYSRTTYGSSTLKSFRLFDGLFQKQKHYNTCCFLWRMSLDWPISRKFWQLWAVMERIRLSVQVAEIRFLHRGVLEYSHCALEFRRRNQLRWSEQLTITVYPVPCSH